MVSHTRQISFQKLILVALNTLCEHLIISAVRGSENVRISPPNGLKSSSRRSMVRRLRDAMTVTHGKMKSSRAEAAAEELRCRRDGEVGADPPARCLFQKRPHQVLAGAGRNGRPDHHGVEGGGVAEGPPDGVDAAPECREVIRPAHVWGRQREEDERLAPREVDAVGGPEARRAEVGESGRRDVDEGDVVPGPFEAGPGSGADHARTDDEDASHDGLRSGFVPPTWSPTSCLPLGCLKWMPPRSP